MKRTGRAGELGRTGRDCEFGKIGKPAAGVNVGLNDGLKAPGIGVTGRAGAGVGVGNCGVIVRKGGATVGKNGAMGDGEKKVVGGKDGVVGVKFV